MAESGWSRWHGYLVLMNQVGVVESGGMATWYGPGRCG